MSTEKAPATRCEVQVLRGNALSYCYNTALPGTKRCARHTGEPQKKGIVLNLTREEAEHTVDLDDLDTAVRRKLQKALAPKPWEPGWKPEGSTPDA